MIKVSAVVTCFNNESSIVQCIESLAFADEIVVLDSFSQDKTLELLAPFACKIHQQKFKGFSQQKQEAINLAQHDWVLLLDSDEFLSTKGQNIISDWKKHTKTAQVAAYALPRREWVFWQWSHPWTHKNKFVRLFNRHKAFVSKDKVHESIKSKHCSSILPALIYHKGETSIRLKMEKINQYSQLAAEQKFQAGKRVSPIKLLFYPVWYFFKQYFIRRQIFNGWAGVINASLNSHYAFLKYAKLYELQKNKN